METVPTNTGTIVTMYFPRAQFDQDDVATSVETMAVASEPGTRILLVEDEEIVGRFLSQALEQTGFIVTVVTCIFEANGYLDEHANDVDLVLLDMTLPDGSGERVFTHCRSIRHDLPFVVLSGFADREDINALRRHGCSVLSKPIPLADLVQAVNEILTRRTD